MTRQVLMGVLVVALLACAGFGWLAWTLGSSERAMQAWPTVPGRVLSVQVLQQRLDAVSAKATSASHMYWVLDLRYEYQVGGRRLVGTEVSNHPPRVKPGAADEAPPAELLPYLQRYAAGTAVTVRHHPGKPERSTLEVDTSGSRWFWTAAGVSLLVALLLGASLAWLRSASAQ